MTLRRKTKSEKQRQRIEEAELQRRLEAGEPVHSVRSSNVEGPDPEAVAALRAYDEAVRAAADESFRLEPKEGRPACWKHPDWKPKQWTEGQPLPASTSCPDCVAEFDRKPVGPTVWVDGTPQQRMSPQQEIIFDRWMTKRYESGEILAGSRDEEEVLAYMNERREFEREKAAGGRVVYSRHFGGPDGGPLILRRSVSGGRGSSASERRWRSAGWGRPKTSGRS